MRIPEAFLQTLRERADIVAWVQERTPLKKMGINYGACCPFHDEKTPSFTVSPNKQFFHCFGCGAHGDVIAFVSRFDGLPFVEAVEKIATQLGLSLPQDQSVDSAVVEQQKQLMTLCSQAAVFYSKVLSSSEGAAARTYLNARGITQKTIETFGLGYAPMRWDGFYPYAEQKLGFSRQLLKSAGLVVEKKDSEGVYDRFRGRLMFPIQDSRGRYVGFGGRVLESQEGVKYLNSPETPIFHKGHILYGMSQALRQGAVPAWIVVEGYMDVIALHQAGIMGAVATLGTALTIDHIKRLGQANIPIYFCFDGDAAGQKAAWRSVQACLPWMEAGRAVSFITLPPDEDPDSLVRRSGKEGFERYQAQALGFSDFFFSMLSKQVSLETLEGRAQLVALAEPLLRQMPEGVYQQMVRDRLKELAGLVRHRGAFEPRARYQPRQREISTPMLSLTRKARWLLGAQPALRAEVTERAWAVLEGLPGADGAWFKAFRANTAPRVEAEASAWLALFGSEEAIALEWRGVMDKLIVGHKQRQIEFLLTRAKQGLLEEAEKQTLKKLLES